MKRKAVSILTLFAMLAGFALLLGSCASFGAKIGTKYAIPDIGISVSANMYGLKNAVPLDERYGYNEKIIDVVKTK
jgi:hypothetical protein